MYSKGKYTLKDNIYPTKIINNKNKVERSETKIKV